MEKIGEVVREAMSGPVDAVAVTYGPGLSPALLVGLNAAKGLARALGVPLFGINHIEAHLHTPFLRDAADGAQGQAPDPADAMPALGLAISGGHTAWIDMTAYGTYSIVGQTLDDAAGEAFDKAAKLLGLGYPGGPVVDKIAKTYLAEFGSSALIPFPKGRPREGVSALAGLPAELCVSFSGLKTALLRYVQKEGGAEAIAAAGETPRLVASYQEAIVQAVAGRTRTALRRACYRSLVVGGGVSLNSRLRTVLAQVADEAGVRLLLAKPRYCGDNGAMIAGLAYCRRGTAPDAAKLDVCPGLEVGI